MESANSSIYREGYQKANATLAKPLITQGDQEYSSSSSASSDAEEYSTRPLVHVERKKLRRNFDKGILYQFISMLLAVAAAWVAPHTNEPLFQQFTVAGLVMLLTAIIFKNPRKWDRVQIEKHTPDLVVISLAIIPALLAIKIGVAIDIENFDLALYGSIPLLGFLLGAIFLKETIGCGLVFGFLVAIGGIFAIDSCVITCWDEVFDVETIPLACTSLLLVVALLFVKRSEKVHWVAILIYISIPITVVSPLLVWWFDTYSPLSWTSFGYILLSAILITASLVFLIKSLQKIDLLLNLPMMYLAIAVTTLTQGMGGYLKVAGVCATLIGVGTMVFAKENQIKAKISDLKDAEASYHAY
eukprot:CAMPEP_0115016146 /NCGR_PEP_ID=MMETSP0216-20121206/27241_1 /TAXON_ID=223996 /ORGANISM="Protocruzia adherens, Strain Boccale" /LENGTH=357 /DNA_ID=CAMNT_0002386503 /DNA_START=101 /DNA_END=1174 /DNA_ORIENTATION=+